MLSRKEINQEMSVILKTPRIFIITAILMAGLYYLLFDKIIYKRQIETMQAEINLLKEKQPEDNNSKFQIDNRNGVFSQNQNGGIITGKINIETPKREMNEILGNQIKQMIPTSKRITIDCIMGDGEGFNFANEIKDWMSHNGYKDIYGVNQAVYNKPMIGQIVDTAGGNYRLIIGTKP